MEEGKKVSTEYYYCNEGHCASSRNYGSLCCISCPYKNDCGGVCDLVKTFINTGISEGCEYKEKREGWIPVKLIKELYPDSIPRTCQFCVHSCKMEEPCSFWEVIK